MTPRQQAASPSAPLPGSRERLAAASLALYAVLAPLMVAALAGPLPLRFFGTLVLATSLLGPGLATILVCWRGLGATARALAAHRDGEAQQAVVRLLISAAALVYLGALSATAPFALRPQLLAIVVAGSLWAWLLFVLALFRPAAAPRRCALAMAGDIAFISVFLSVGGAVTAPWVSAYLWVILAAGLRFGAPYVSGATVLGVLGFAAVVTATPFWQEQPVMDAAMLVALLVPPIYVVALARRLTAASVASDQARTAKTRLLAVMSHELRTPLNTLVGMGSLLARTRLDPEQGDMLGTMRLSARTLSGLLNDLLDLSKLEAGKLAPKTEIFVLREVLGGAVAILRPQAQAKALELALIVDPRLPHVCRGLPLQLRQVLMNLLANAIKFTPRGHVSVAATQVSRAPGAVRLRLAVRDEGIGIPAAARERIFGIFAQADETVTNRFGGTGLGLAIAKQIVDLMGGTIAVESEIGAGSTFTVEIPLICEENAAVRPPDLIGRRIAIVSPDRELAGTLQTWLRAWRGETQWYEAGEEALTALGREPGARQVLLIDGRSDPLAGLSLAHRLATLAAERPTILFIAPAQASEAVAGLAATQLAAVIEEPVSELALASAFLSMLAGAGGEDDEAPPAPALRVLRVLIADDDTANREVLKNLLGRAGHQVETATDGGAALAALDRGGFDLALLDLNMPGMSGDAVAKLYRMRHPGERMPLVALTADATGETELLCREAGFDAVLTKPLEAGQLLAAIEELRARRAAEKGAPAALPGPMVTPITDHPRFLGDGAEVMDESTFTALRGLGGADFVAVVVEIFRTDAVRLIGRLRQVIERSDHVAFGEIIHSLRSGAANIGGVRLSQTLTALEDVTAKDLRQAGPAYFEKIESEFERLCTAIEPLRRSHRHG